MFMELAMQMAPFWRVLLAKRRDTVEPVGLIGAEYQYSYLQPHVEWFAWASDRNKVETIVKFLADLDEPAMIWTRTEEAPFWRRMGHYGVLKQGCELPSLYGDEDGMLWRTT